MAYKESHCYSELHERTRGERAHCWLETTAGKIRLTLVMNMFRHVFDVRTNVNSKIGKGKLSPTDQLSFSSFFFLECNSFFSADGIYKTNLSICPNFNMLNLKNRYLIPNIHTYILYIHIYTHKGWNNYSSNLNNFITKMFRAGFVELLSKKFIYLKSLIWGHSYFIAYYYAPECYY